VVGGGDADEGDLEAAEAVGALLAAGGAVLVCGGLGGMMEAACRGAASSGGVTLGLLPGDDPSDANPWVTIPLATGLGHLRNALVARVADVVVAIGGAHGTLSEVAMALTVGTPVIGLATWDLVRPDGRADDGITRVDDPGAATRAAFAAVGGGPPTRPPGTAS
jgi:uncharacterized protein (TIGR00725 family)